MTKRVQLERNPNTLPNFLSLNFATTPFFYFTKDPLFILLNANFEFAKMPILIVRLLP